VTLPRYYLPISQMVVRVRVRREVPLIPLVSLNSASGRTTETKAASNYGISNPPW
jgi:hypothetical protein